jgi:hypothetical protein
MASDALLGSGGTNILPIPPPAPSSGSGGMPSAGH